MLLSELSLFFILFINDVREKASFLFLSDVSISLTMRKISPETVSN